MSVVTMGLRKKESEIQSKVGSELCRCCSGSGTQIKGTVEVSRIGLTDLYDDCISCSGLGRVETVYRKIAKRPKPEGVCIL